MRLPRILAALALFCFGTASFAQTPRVYLKFDGNVSDSSGAGVITTVAPSAGFTPGYATDRHGIANRALALSGGRSVRLVASSLPGNSNQALGLRNASGTNTSFTLSAWVYFTSLGSNQGYSTVFGNLGTGGGTLHAGLGNNSDKAHFGFDGNDVNGGVAGFVTNTWYHVAFVYDAATQTQRIFVNGIPEVTRSGVTNTLKAADLLLGNWGTENSTSNDMKGRLDEVAVFNTVLASDQIQALSNGASATTIPVAGTYSAPKLPGTTGTAGAWGIREIKAYPGISYSSLVNADRIVRAYATAPNGTVAEYQAPVVNFIDDEGPGQVGYFPNESNFGTDTPADDSNVVMIAKCAVRILVEDDYTFGFRGDDGSRLRVIGQHFKSSTRINTGNPADPAHHGDGIYYTGSTGDSNTIGVVRLKPGEYNLELVWWEGGGGSSLEVFAARGAKTSVDSSFQLVGNTAAGGLEIVRDPDIVPAFTINSGNSLFIHNGSPSSFTLAWSVSDPATQLSINQGIGPVAQSGTRTVATPAFSTTYTITATTGGAVITKSVTAYVNSAPQVTFTADDTTVTSGAPVLLSWQAEGATSLTLQPGNINVTGQTSRVVNPTSTTTYSLIATNPSGSTQKQVAVIVGTAPGITSFTAADSSPLFGAETSLSWNVSNAASISINQGIGTVTGATGSVQIAPIQTTTYTLTASNEYGAATRSTTLNQPTPIGVSSAGFAVRRVNSTVPFPYGTRGYLDSADSLLGGENAGTEATGSGYSTINFSDGADGNFTSGNSPFPGGGGDNYAVRVTGTLVVNTPGEYTFVMSSDDGGRLRVNGQEVIADDSTHTPNAKSGKIILTGPTAELELVHYDATGGSTLELGWIRPDFSWQLISTVSPAASIVRGGLIISEFMAENSSALLDEDGDASDWIEIWNSSSSPVNLAGYYLTDNATIPGKWALPARTLAANEYLVVFASGKNRTIPTANLHTSFKLSTLGGYLGLTRSDGAGGFTGVSEFAPAYPPQNADISYGSSDAEGYIGFMSIPTPGGPNAPTVTGFIKDTQFSHKRGRYSAPFALAISTATPGAAIRYTTDGSTPSLNHGEVYTGPIPISKTTIVRSAAFRPGWKATNVDTQSYLFLDDVITQTADTAIEIGFPSTSVNGKTFRYGMNSAAVTSAGGTLQQLKDALAAAPSVCMTTDVGNLVDPSTGIYVNPGRRGLFWERPTSIEYINPAGTSEFQIDCGVRIRGGASRSASNPKHAFHLYFRGLYDGDLKYRLFGTNGTNRFDQIDMRCEQNYSWSKDNGTQNSLMREEWSRVTQGDMGQPWSRTGYFHLYINGIYWGVYNWEERTEADFGASYLGGHKSTFDTVKSAGSSGGYNTEVTDGHFAAWRSLFDQCVALKNDPSETGRTAKYMRMRGLNPDGTRNPDYPVLLDADNLADFMLTTWYDGSFDAPMSTFLSNASNNWFGVRDRAGERGFAFFAHDHEHGMDSTGTNSYNRVGPWGDPNATGNNWGQTWSTSQYRSRENFAKFNPQYVHELLAFSAEYRQRFADRAQKHLFNGGALTTAQSVARVETLATQVDSIIHAEAARWGSTSRNRNTWLGAKNTVLNFINNGGSTPGGGQTTWPAQPRASLLIEQLRGYTDSGAKPLFPPSTLSAPAFSGQFGGAVLRPYSFSISNPNASGTIYYTVNGGDPRALGGGIAAGVQTGAAPINITLQSTATVRARIYNSNTQIWSAMVEADYLVGALASAANLVISKIHYNPPGAGDLDEFLEVMNIGSEAIDLTNVRFTLGILFQFPDQYTLAPGARALIVRDSAGFAAAYSNVPSNLIAGAFANDTALDNSGERLQLVDAANAVIRDFSYDDVSLWPSSPDGGGPALVLLKPETNPPHGNPANWRASAFPGGSPGFSDAYSYSTWASANGVTDVSGTLDDDLDGISNLMEYALGTPPKQPSATQGQPTLGLQSMMVDGVISQYLTLTLHRPLGRDDLQYSAQAGNTVGAWIPAFQVGLPSYNSDGTETITYRHPAPITAEPRQFLRIRVTRQ